LANLVRIELCPTKGPEIQLFLNEGKMCLGKQRRE